MANGYEQKENKKLTSNNLSPQTEKDSSINDQKQVDNESVHNDTDSNSMPLNATVTDEQVINWIKSRRSIGNLNIPAPNPAQIEAAIQCAMTAPDHKQLQPWRFTIVKDQARHDMGRALLQAAEAKAIRDGQQLDDRTKEKTLKMPLRAPTIIVVSTRMKYHEKVPSFEQLLSAGAAVQNLILALKAQGFSSVWRTGPLANEPALKQFFNVGSEDYITAFVYVGKSHCEMPNREDFSIDDFVTYK